MRHKFSILIGGALSCVLIAAQGAPITVQDAFVYRDNEGPNTIGSGEGDNLTVVVRQVSPNLTTYASATNPQVGGSIQLQNLFTSGFGFFNRTFAGDAREQGGVVTQPWQVTLQNISGSTSNTLVVDTNSLVGVGQLPLLGNLTVSGPAMSPTLSWDPVVTPTFYDQIRLNIYNDRTNQLIVTEQLIGAPGTTNYTVPLGTLAPNTNYAFRVYLWDSRGPGGVSLNRSSTHINTTTTSASVSAGALVITKDGTANAPLTLVSGANDHPNSAITIGATGRGAATLQSGTTLTGTFLNVGTNIVGPGPRYGTLIVDNTTVTMNGGTVNDGTATSSGGGFVTAGRNAGARGFIDVINGGQILINGSGFLNPGLNIGREAGSFGTVTVDGAGSRIVISGPNDPNETGINNGSINVGREGDGRLNILNGGQVTNAALGEMAIGRFAGSRGSVLVSGTGSELSAGSLLSIGRSGGGEGVLFIRDGATVRADETILGPGGFLGGCDGGTLVSQLTVAGGILAPGCSPGKLKIVGDLIFNDGVMLLEAFGPGQIDEIEVIGKIFIGADAEIDILLGFEPLGVLSFFTATEGIVIDEDFSGPSVFGLLGSDAPVGSSVTIRIGDETFDVRVQGAPEPGTLALLALGLVGLAATRRRRQ